MRGHSNRFRTTAILIAAFLIAAGGAWAQDYRPLPDPVLALNGTAEYTPSGGPAIMYKLKVTNWASYPDGLFVPRPDLPACGANTSASRTWVDIYNGDDNSYIYGFCALGSGSDLTDIWFGELLPGGTTPPAHVYIKITDRDPAFGGVYTSNTIAVYSPTAPVAGADTLTTNEDTPSTVNVLSNDSDINGDALSVSAIASPPAHGTAVSLGGGNVQYSPAANYNGSDTFSYSVFDGTYTTTASVSVTVTSVPDPPNPPSVLLTDSRVNPNNVSHYVPVFSWTFSDVDMGDASGDWQTAYQIIIGPTPGSSTAWDSGKLSSLASSGSYAGTELAPNTTWYWSVRTWDKYDLAGSYSASGTFTILDIGLRIYDGTSVIRVAADYVNPTYKLRIYKNGVTYGIILVDPSDPEASKVRIQTPAGIKAYKRM